MRRYTDKLSARGSVVGAVVAALLVLASAAIHLRLYFLGYSGISPIGPLFVVQAAGGVLLALVTVAVRRLGTVLLCAGYLAVSLAGLFWSVHFGLFGFHETLAAPYAGVSIAVEGAGSVVCFLVLLVGAADRGQTRAVPGP